MALVLSNTSEPSSRSVAGLAVPDSKLAREVTELVKDTESPLPFHHSSRVYYWGALTGKRWGLRFDPELLYAGAMFHDIGLTPEYASQHFSPASSCSASFNVLTRSLACCHEGPRHRT